jgi:undecaprenyl-diphosphatase
MQVAFWGRPSDLAIFREGTRAWSVSRTRGEDQRQVSAIAAEPDQATSGQTPIVTRRRVIDRRVRIVAGVVALLGLSFVVLALTLRAAGGTSIDLAVTRAVQLIDAPAFTALMVAISAPGYAPWMGVILWSASLGLLLGGLWREAIFVLATEGAGVLAATVKLLVERPRPTAEAVRVASALVDYSFPSGHVVGYVTLFGFLAFVLFVRFRKSWWRTLALALLGLLIGLVGVSRIHLGYHWASDVLGGYALGTAYLLVLIEAYRLVGRWIASYQVSPKSGVVRRTA